LPLYFCVKLGVLEVRNTADFLKSKINIVPDVAIILGSGLGELADEYGSLSISYADIPGFVKSTVHGHKGNLVLASISGKNILMMQGRYHYYEGHSLRDITFPIKIFKKLGVKTIIITNAAGSLNPDYMPGDLMLINDHINFMGTNPLIGENDDEMGDRFPDMSEIYNKDLIRLAHKCAHKLGIELKEGIYLGGTGPSYETPAEIRMMRNWGADAVGMSTVTEAIVANWCRLKVLGISCISNAASGLINGKKLSHTEVIETTNAAKDKFKKLIVEVITEMEC